MKVVYRQAADDDVVRQFRYYLVAHDLPGGALRFRDGVRASVELLLERPHLGPRYALRNPQLQNLRSWPVKNFGAVRIYYVVDGGTIRVIRILHGKRNVRRILEHEQL